MTLKPEGKCPECRGSGRGQFDHNKNASCDTCHGTGKEEVPLLNPDIGLTVDEVVDLYENPPDDHSWGVINVANAIWDKGQVPKADTSATLSGSSELARTVNPTLREKIKTILVFLTSESQRIYSSQVGIGRMNDLLDNELIKRLDQIIGLLPSAEECNQLCCDFIAMEARKQERERIEITIYRTSTWLGDMVKQILSIGEGT